MSAGIVKALTILKSSGVLATRRNGKQVLCSLAIPEVKQACELIRRVLEAHIAQSQRLIEQVIIDFKDRKE